MQDAVWAISLAVRALAVAICWRRASREWTAWAVFYLASGIILRTLDILHWYGPHGWYVYVWILQQVISTGLLVFVVRREINPTFLLGAISVVAAILTAAITAQNYHWPNSPIETTMTACGTASLALGIIAALGLVSRRTISSAILAVFLLGYALLSLGGADYLKTAQLGIAWSVLEITCFGAWIFCD